MKYIPSEPISPEILEQLSTRLSATHLRQRLGIEQGYEKKVFAQGRARFFTKHYLSNRSLLLALMKVFFLHKRGRNNARQIAVQDNILKINGLPAAFEGYRLLHITDMHLDLVEDMGSVLAQAVAGLEYDACVMTGDFRAWTFGPSEACMQAMKRVRDKLSSPVYAVLGNHDSITLLPALEKMGVRVLMNESIALKCDDESIYLAGVDDPHYFHADNIEKAAEDIPSGAASILLSHSPETYNNAAHAGFDAFLCGHTHGGQVCLPGGIALAVNVDCPRRYCRGSWQYLDMVGFTSVGSGACLLDVRFNCPPEVVIHHLRRA